MVNPFLKTAIRGIMHRKVRAILTMLGIIIGIASIVALVSLNDGLENAIEEEFEKRGSRLVRVVPKGLRGPPTDADVLNQNDVRTVEKVKGLEYVTTLLLQSGRVEHNNEKQLIMVTAMDPDVTDKLAVDLSLEIDLGRQFKPGDSGVAMIGPKFGEINFNDDLPLRGSVKVEGKKFRIIGIMKESGNADLDNSLYLPLEDAQEIFDKPNGFSIIAARVAEGLDVVEVQENIRVKLEKERDNENFDVITPAQIIEQLNLILGVLQFILVGIAAISLVVGGIGIMNSMYTSVLERTKDIGTMKSIGARNRDILMIFLFESGLIGFTGGFIGAVLGTGFAFLMGGVAKLAGFGLLSIKFNLGLFLFGIFFAFIVGMLSGVLPAYRASKLSPVDALRYE